MSIKKSLTTGNCAASEAVQTQHPSVKDVYASDYNKFFRRLQAVQQKENIKKRGECQDTKNPRCVGGF